MPIEKDCRRDDFREGIDILMPDFQTWTFPRLQIGLIPKPDGWRPVLAACETNTRFGARFSALQHDLMAAVDGLADDHDGEMSPFYPALARIAADLLRRNYDLADEDLDTLMIFIPGDPENLEGWRKVVALATNIKFPAPSIPGASGDTPAEADPAASAA